MTNKSNGSIIDAHDYKPESDIYYEHDYPYEKHLDDGNEAHPAGTCGTDNYIEEILRNGFSGDISNESEIDEDVDGTVCCDRYRLSDYFDIDDCNDAEDYHNEAAGYAKNNDVKTAAKICSKGLEVFPDNINLLADMVKFSADYGDFTTAETYYARLKEHPYKCWTWSAFTYAIHYLLSKDVIAIEEECRMLISKFMSVFPYNPDAYEKLYLLETAVGNHDKAFEVLTKTVGEYNNAETCALHLADLLLERGMYSELKDICLYGIAASASPQPSIRTPYLSYLMNLADDHMLWIRAREHDKITAAEVDRVRNKYLSLVKRFTADLIPYLKNIDVRIDLFEDIPIEE